MQAWKPPIVPYLSKHVARVQGISGWTGRRARHRAARASAWRHPRATVEGRAHALPTAQWVNAHRDLEDAVLADGTAYKYVGNF